MTALRPGASPPPVDIAILKDSPPSPEELEDFSRRGMAPAPGLGKDQAIVGGDLEDASR
jgi:hypothetical protein